MINLEILASIKDMQSALKRLKLKRLEFSG